MGGEWKTRSLDELYTFSSGLSKPRSSFGSGYPFLSFKDVFNNAFVPQEFHELVESTEGERHGCSIRRGDAFLTRTSETMDELGMSSVALADIPDATFNGFTKRLRPKSGATIVPEYAGYYFRSPAFRLDITAMSSLSTRASLNNEMLARLHVRFPPPDMQCAIAGILKSLDNKIELNRRMNETLEAMSRALFRSWFVDFDPVRAKTEGRWHRGESLPGLPAHLFDLFPDRLVDSELGEIPEGWGWATVADLAQVNPESWAKDNYPDFISYVDLSNTKWGRIEAVAHRTRANAPSRARRILRAGDTIVGTVRPGNGSYTLITEDGLTGSTGFAVLRPRRTQYTEFVYLAATHRENIETLSHLADGGAYPAVRPDVVAATPITKPSDDVLSRFSRVTQGHLARMAQNGREADTLAALRDALLPELIAGELRLDDRDRDALERYAQQSSVRGGEAGASL